jgi:DNA-directed RNA polymerase specialized sigma24 family protein
MATASILLDHLRALIRQRMQSGQSLVQIAADTGLVLGSLRKWLYRARTGDAAAMEHAIRLMGGGTIVLMPYTYVTIRKPPSA